MSGGARRPVGLRVAPVHPPPDVSIANHQPDLYTNLDVSANDRLGLLHDLTRTIAEHGYEVYISKAANIRDQVADTFYIKDQDGRKILDAERLEVLSKDLLAAIEAGEAGRGG